MNELEALTVARDRHVSDAELFEARAREARFVERTLTERIENLKAAQEGRPHAKAKFRIGQKVRFTKGAQEHLRMPTDEFIVQAYESKVGPNLNWDTVRLSDDKYYSQRWLEDAEETS